jgi:hypothetical protein
VFLDSPISRCEYNKEFDRFPILSRFDDSENFFDTNLLKNHPSSFFEDERSKNLTKKLSNQSHEWHNPTNFQSRKHNDVSNRNSPDYNVNYVSQAYIQPKLEKKSNSKTVPIKIYHRTTSPKLSEFNGYTI